MPNLPSGRTVAINMKPLFDLAEQAKRNPSLLLFVEDVDQLLSMIRIVEVEEAVGIPDAELDRLQVPGGHRYGITHDMGLSVYDVLSGRSGWSAADTLALKQSILSDRIRRQVIRRMWELMQLRKRLYDQALADLRFNGVKPRSFYRD
jgi:hypothetical protein